MFLAWFLFYPVGDKRVEKLIIGWEIREKIVPVVSLFLASEIGLDDPRGKFYETVLKNLTLGLMMEKNEDGFREL